MKKKLLFVDLDDTLIKNINNTFDFLKAYLYYKYGLVGLFRYIIVSILFFFLSKISKNVFLQRRIAIILLSFGESVEELIKFAISIWLRYIRNNFNKDVLLKIEELRRSGFSVILLTSCIEIPAKIICKYLKFDDCLTTEFKVWRNRVIAISLDNYGPAKFIYSIKKYGYNNVKDSIYIVDEISLAIEKANYFVNKIIVV